MGTFQGWGGGGGELGSDVDIIKRDRVPYQEQCVCGSENWMDKFVHFFFTIVCLSKLL